MLQPGMSLTLEIEVSSIGQDTLYLEATEIEDEPPFDATPFDVDLEGTELLLPLVKPPPVL